MGKIHIIIGIIIGIMFSVAYPDMAQSINDAIMPTVQTVGERIFAWIFG